MKILDDIQRRRLEQSLERLVGKGQIDPGYSDAQIVTMAIDELSKNLLTTVKMSATLASLIGKNTDMIMSTNQQMDEVYGTIMGLNSKIGLAMEKINASLN
jgi:hypothetical protein